MAIRERLRKTFGGKKKDGSASGKSSTSSDPTHYTGRTDIEYYKPHEIPKSKYRGRVDPEHQERLDTYSFADAFDEARRRGSRALSGIMSPGGTKSQSRRTSYMSHVSRDAPIARSTAATPAPVELDNPLSRRPTNAGQPAALIRENSDDDTDILNTGLSRSGTTKQDNDNIPTLRLEREASSPQHDSDATTPANSYMYDHHFSADELEKAMTKATIKGTDNTPITSSIPVAAH